MVMKEQLRHEVVESLGGGGYGQVFRCVEHNVNSREVRGEVAVKVAKSSQPYKICALEEIDILDVVSQVYVPC